ncbi:hypothetical protein G7Y89_g15181 [Cudoniella acicularis]|uniref:Rhodopsin domain-containing protein n=1 Tax=Cudoniella acicularis TaxID=354080 RepID=A0A8H4QT36_9HELO|nr:hypothetical protein G7Y89_g15181 [Cudoniella acicularis]
MDGANSTAITGVVAPPDGETANFVSPETQQGFEFAAIAICLFLVTICVAIRLYTRIFITQRMGWDDYTCIAAYILTILTSTLHLVADSNGLGRHLWDIPASQYPNALKPFVIAIGTYLLLQMSVKLTCLLFYRTIFSSAHKTTIFVNVGIGFVIVVYLGMFFESVFECNPVARAWDRSIPGTCTNAQGVISFFSGGVNAFSDIYILLVPVPAVYALPLGRWQKIRILAVFSLGLFACALSAVRIFMLYNESRSIDFSWETTRVGIWSVIEVNVGLICACLFVFPAFLKHHGHSLSKYMTRRSSRNSYSIPLSDNKTTSNYSSTWSAGNRSRDRTSIHPGTKVIINPETDEDLELGSRASSEWRVNVTRPLPAISVDAWPGNGGVAVT